MKLELSRRQRAERSGARGQAARPRKILLRARRRGAVLLCAGALVAVSLPVTPAHAAPTRYEAENATVSQGVVESTHPGFSGTGFVNYNNVAGSYVQWTVTAATAGTATLVIRFANGTAANRPMDIAVNGTRVAAGLAFPGTGGWGSWSTATLTAPVAAGTNTVRATATAAAGGPNVDWLSVDLGGGGGPPAAVMAAPYYYNGWGNPPNIRAVMSATGIKQFTMAFMLSGGGCVPMWDSQRPLRGGVDEATINAIRAGGGDVEISFGGWSGNKLGPNCSTPQALAGAYQQVINAYNLRYIDIDIENTDEFENPTVMDRILNALRIVKQNNPAITTIITFGTGINGPSATGVRLINRSAQLQTNIDVYTIMPFDFGCQGMGRMVGCTISSSEGLKNRLKAAFGWSDATAYAHMGISGMNGHSDVGEVTSTRDWEQIRDWANARRLARLAFWSVNRDRPCPGGGLRENCSGIAQSAWQFTSITAGFTGP
jgi:chitinase